MIGMMLVAVVMLTGTAVLAEPPSIPNHGLCPLGYWRSGSLCVPIDPRAPPAVPKGAGLCSPGSWQSGSYCVPVDPRTPTAMPKAAEPCPSGYRLKSRACVRIK